VANRGVEQRDIFLDDRDRRTFVRMLAEAVPRFRWCLHAFVLMTRWSSYRTTAGLAKGPPWLTTAAILDRFDPRRGRKGAGSSLLREIVSVDCCGTHVRWVAKWQEEWSASSRVRSSYPQRFIGDARKQWIAIQLRSHRRIRSEMEPVLLRSRRAAAICLSPLIRWRRFVCHRLSVAPSAVVRRAADLLDGSETE
jgi:hypothetical protein